MGLLRYAMPPSPHGVAQADQLSSKVGSHLALWCIHRMNRVNSHSALRQHHKDYPSIIIVIIIL